MAATRLSQLQKRILRWLAADAQRTQGVIASSHQEWGCALQGDKGTSSHRLRTLEAHQWIVIGRSTGGQAEDVVLTPRGQNWVAPFAGSCDSGGSNREAMRGAASIAHRLTTLSLPVWGLPQKTAELRQRVRNVSMGQ
jgi:hypothetical protein